MVIRKGEIWWATLPESLGSEPACRRPVVIAQSSAINASAINTVIVIVITKNLRLGTAPGNVVLPKKISGLKYDSVVNVSQVLTLDKSRLTESVCVLPQNIISKIEADLRVVLDL